MTTQNLIGRKIVVKETTDIMSRNFLEAGTTGYVIRQGAPGNPPIDDQTLLYVAFDKSPSGMDENERNWFIDTENVDVVPSEVDGLRIVYLKDDLCDDDGLILQNGSIGYVIEHEEGDAVVSAAFPKQDGRRNAGRAIGVDNLILHHIATERLEFA